MNQEKPFHPISGWLVLPTHLVLYGLAVWWFVVSVRTLQDPLVPGGGWSLAGSIALFLVSFLTTLGHFIINPNDSKAMVLFGVYRGTVLRNGFWWALPFYSKSLVSLRARNLNGEKLKVNDRAGNPIEIAAVVVWKVKDTFQALFEVDDYRHYVTTQSEAAVRQLAGTYPYDAHLEEDEHDETQVSLRAGREQVDKVLEKQLAERLGRAGVEVLEARLSHLAYAPEIAGAMLQRQQAMAIVAARRRIVDGAVGMVKMALSQLKEDKVLELDEERKAAMVSNLLVVLCGHQEPQAVINTGTLYT